MRELIDQLINKYGSLRKVAAKYGMYHQTIKNWYENEKTIKTVIEFYEKAKKDLNEEK